MNLEESFIWMSYFAGQQKMALKKRNTPKPKPEMILELGDGMVIDLSDDNEVISLDNENKVYIGKNSKWGNPFESGGIWTDTECKELYPAHFWSSNLYDELDELINKRLYVHTGEDEFHGQFLRDMIKEKAAGNKPGPTIPPIHLYNLHRRKIYLEIVKDKENPKKIGKLVFHMFDVEDDLTFEKVIACLKTIFEFMTYHEILRPFSINIYT